MLLQTMGLLIPYDKAILSGIDSSQIGLSAADQLLLKNIGLIRISE